MSALRDAALEAGSVEGEEFDIRFNVDALSPGVTHADPPVRHTSLLSQKLGLAAYVTAIGGVGERS